jgi:DNA-binding beta-propeller fold protein YncE
MTYRILAALVGLVVLGSGIARAEMLAMLNYESKPKQSLKALKLSVGPLRDRAEGIAIMDADPASENFGKILYDIPLPPDLVAHHIFYNKDLSKAYITALGKSELRVMDMKRFPYRIKTIALPDCQAGEDAVVSDDNSTWYVTCMGTDKIVVGDAAGDTVTGTITAGGDKAFVKYPHGISVHNGIDRMLVTTTVRASDLGDPGESISVIEASTGKVLSTHKVTDKGSPGGEAPVEIVFLPRSDPPMAYITNMFANSISAAVWNPATKDFEVTRILDTAPFGGGVPLEVYFNKKMDRLFVTTANPGHFHIFDIADPMKPKHIKSIATAGGAHHVAITHDEKLAVVQNSFINLPGMSDGSLSVIDLEKQEVVATINTFKEQGFNPNLIVFLPEHYNAMGHCNNGPKSCF